MPLLDNSDSGKISLERASEVYLMIAFALNRLEEEMVETKELLESRGKHEVWEKFWGHSGRNNYEGARKELVKAYDNLVPEGMREDTGYSFAEEGK